MSATTRTAHGSAQRESTTTTNDVQAPAEPAYELVDLDRYMIMHDGPVGYVEVVPPVFVCYAGHPYAKAEEVAQKHDFQSAVQTVIAHAVSARRARLTA
ncbi:MAG: hypothetical protein JF592_00640 [Microbacterium sp.]|uniref:hypothetical protein n=1 Tax=Microbacterium sp. TaxID=51671 RepID=UPI001DFE89F0|nr:hypothetical protein [Microbacterium sp.]MBW8761076.1 hypothetical protein [Microbacterium sp.]